MTGFAIIVAALVLRSALTDLAGAIRSLNTEAQ